MVGVSALNVSFAGTYNIDSNHRGAFTLTSTSGSKTFSCSLGSISGGVASKGRFVQFDDVNGTSGQRGSGVLRLQDPSAFTLAAISGPYAFGFSGLDASGKREILAGRLDANGAGTIANGLEDLNDNTVVTNSVAFTGSYTAPSASKRRNYFLLPRWWFCPQLSAYVVRHTKSSPCPPTQFPLDSLVVSPLTIFHFLCQRILKRRLRVLQRRSRGHPSDPPPRLACLLLTAQEISRRSTTETTPGLAEPVSLRADFHRSLPMGMSSSPG
jgi:hypothetical protein